MSPFWSTVEWSTSGGAQQRGVLALLVLSRNRAVSADGLANRLWPDEQPLSATKTVQIYVSRIRKVLGPYANRLLTTRAGYVLHARDDEVDVGRFERLLREGREQKQGTESTRRSRHTRWLFASGADRHSLSLQSTRLRCGRLATSKTSRLEATEELFELRLLERGGRDVAAELRGAADEHPERETALLRLLMLALYQDDRQAEALAAYHAARRHLQEEFGSTWSSGLQQPRRGFLPKIPRLLADIRSGSPDRNRSSTATAVSMYIAYDIGPSSDVAEVGRKSTPRYQVSAPSFIGVTLGLSRSLALGGIALVGRPALGPSDHRPRARRSSAQTDFVGRSIPATLTTTGFGCDSYPSLFQKASLTGVTAYLDGFMADRGNP